MDDMESVIERQLREVLHRHEGYLLRKHDLELWRGEVEKGTPEGGYTLEDVRVQQEQENRRLTNAQDAQIRLAEETGVLKGMVLTLSKLYEAEKEKNHY